MAETLEAQLPGSPEAIDDEEKENSPNQPDIDIPMQPMTIRKINVNKLTYDYMHYRRSQLNEPSPQLSTLVKFMIEKYNEKQLSGKNPGKRFKTYKINNDDLQSIDRMGFSFTVFSNTNDIQTSAVKIVLKTLKASVESSKTVSNVFGFFRTLNNADEIFALCTGPCGYSPIEEYTDYHFPKQIAFRMLDPKAVSSHSYKTIVGNVLTAKECIRSPEIYDPLKIQKIYTTFCTHFRKDASIFAVEEFRKKDGTLPAWIPKVEIQVGGVRICKRLMLKSYFPILNLFGKVSRGEATFKYVPASDDGMTGQETESDAQDEFEFLTYYTNVPYETWCELDKQLIQELKQCLLEDKSCTWELCHPRINDYYGAEQYRLVFAKNIEPWTDCPISCEEFLIKLVEFHDFDVKQFEYDMGQVRLGFYSDGKWQDEEIIKCFIGHTYYDSKQYFKLNAKWYETSQELHARVDKEFKDCMFHCLIEEGVEGFLPHPWEPENKLTFESLVKDLGFQDEKKQSFLKEFLNMQVSFIDNTGRVLHTKLSGEILKVVPEVNYFKKEIEKILEGNNVISEELLEGKFGENIAKIVYRELAKKRDVSKTYKVKKGETTESRLAVMNACNISNKFTEKEMGTLRKAELAHSWKMDEGEYNETYLYDASNYDGFRQPYKITDDARHNGWLVGDRICPDGIEIFDILQYTKNNLFLYHVKEEFGAKTRDACSQIRNSCGVINDALQSNCNAEKILERFFTSAIRGPDGKNKRNYPVRLQKQMEDFGKDNFTNLFKMYDKQNIVFVYAFVDKKIPHIISKNGIHKEFTADDFRFTGPRNKTKVFAELIEQGYLNSDGSKGPNFNNLHRKENLKFKHPPFNVHVPKVWCLLIGDLSYYTSLIGRIEMLHTRNQVEGLGFIFKVYQIRRPSENSPDPVVSIWGHDDLVQHAAAAAAQESALRSIAKKIKTEC